MLRQLERHLYHTVYSTVVIVLDGRNPGIPGLQGRHYFAKPVEQLKERRIENLSQDCVPRHFDLSGLHCKRKG
jgi:hypothetical protein